jgi:hypothetical protein
MDTKKPGINPAFSLFGERQDFFYHSHVRQGLLNFSPPGLLQWLAGFCTT